MITATQKIAELQSKDIEAQALDKYVEWFFNKYAPDDEYICVGGHDGHGLCSTTMPSKECRYCKRINSKARFHADLIQLVQRIYIQAQAPLLKQLKNVYEIQKPKEITTEN